MQHNTLLIIGYVWPEPQSSAAGRRMLQLIQLFLEAQYDITFVSSSTVSERSYPLERLGIKTRAITLNNESFDEFIRELDPSIVLFDRFMMEEQYGWRVAEQCPNALRVLDTEDLHCLRKGRHKAFKDGKAFDKSYLYSEVAKREIASIYRSDLSIMISKAEIEMLEQDFKMDASLLYYLPFLAAKTQPTEALPAFEAREGFIFIGNYLHAPNYDVVLHLKQNIWPLIRKELPKAQLYVYGAYTSQKVQQLHNESQGFIVKGFADSVADVMQKARVCLAPIRFGAGLKGKLLDAIQNGTPPVTTPVGAEGMEKPVEVCGCIAETTAGFINNAITLYTDKALWQDKQSHRTAQIQLHFGKIAQGENFMKTIEAYRATREARRLQNFTGQMLMHHSLQSTKYLSKWIEEKEKHQS